MPLVGPEPDFGLPSVPASQRNLASLRVAESLKVHDSEMPAYTTPLSIMLFLITSTLLPMDLGLKNINMIDIRVMAAQEAALLCRRLRCFLVLAP